MSRTLTTRVAPAIGSVFHAPIPILPGLVFLVLLHGRCRLSGSGRVLLALADMLPGPLGPYSVAMDPNQCDGLHAVHVDLSHWSLADRWDESLLCGSVPLIHLGAASERLADVWEADTAEIIQSGYASEEAYVMAYLERLAPASEAVRRL